MRHLSGHDLPSILDMIKVTRPDVLKIDIEGAEYDVIPDILKSDLPTQLLIDFTTVCTASRLAIRWGRFPQ